jgi:putative oxidoreductase
MTRGARLGARRSDKMSTGLLIARGVFGIVMAAHGTQKLFGWFGGYGIAGTGASFDALGFRPGRGMAVVAGLSEITSGLLIAAGFLGPFGPALMLSVMIVASSVHWSNGLFAAANGIEVPLLYGAGAVALALTGYGLYSVDAALGISDYWTPGLTATVLALGALGGVANLLLRRAPVQTTATA